MANSQHQNGVTERLIKQVKGVQKLLVRAIGDTKLSYNEMNTLLAEISNLMNKRPIGVKGNSVSNLDYLSLNALLLERSSDRIATGPFNKEANLSDNPKVLKSRFLLVQAITTQFWKIWMANYFSTLVIRQKWHEQGRNLKPVMWYCFTRKLPLKELIS